MVTMKFADEYLTAFTVVGPGTEGRELLEQVGIFAHDWFGRMRGKPDGVSPTIDSDESGDIGYRRFRLELPHASAPKFQMSLDVKLSTTGREVAVNVHSRFQEGGHETPPPNLLAGPPSLIWELLRTFDCYIEGDRLSWEPTTVSKEAAKDFVHNRIFNPQRHLPIIAVSQNWKRQTSLSPNWLQNRLIGLAEVATYDGDTADQLRSLVGFQLACYGGAVRIYQPGCSTDDPRSRHQFWMPNDARALLSRPARERLQEFTQHFADSATTREFENVRLQLQQKRLAEREAEILARPLRQQIGELESEIESLNRRLYESERDAEIGLEELHNLHRQLIDRDSQLDTLRDQLEQAIHREAEYEPEIARLHRQQTERDERIESLRQQLEAAVRQTDSGQSEVVQLHSQLLERNSQVDSLWNELDKAVRKESESEQEIARLRAKIQQSDSEMELLRQQLEDTSREFGASRQAIERLNENLQERESELSVLRGQLEEVLNRSEESGNLVAELSEGLTARDTDIANLRLLLEGVDDGTTDSDRIITELRRELQEREYDARAITSLLQDAHVRAEAAENVAAELRRELDLRPTEQADINNIIQESRGNVAEARIEVAAVNGAVSELLLQIEVQNCEIAKLQQQLTNAQEEALNSVIHSEDLEKKLNQTRDEFRSFRYSVQYQHHWGEAEPEYQDDPPVFDTVEDTVVAADQHFDGLRFLDSAFDTAEYCPFERPYEVYEAFSLLHELAVERNQGTLGKSIEDWMKERGCDYSPRESEATMNKYGESRWFGGILMEAHIKIGSGTANKQHYLRIHFAWGEVEKKFIIGHVGEHLPIVSS